MIARGRASRGLCLLLAALLVAAVTSEAFALIVGGEGNKPLENPGWPAGAAAVFNVKERVAWWEGPPLGGGQWHAECRGDAKALSAALLDFAKVETKNKRVILHDGVGRSLWLNANRQQGKAESAKIDWVFMVWVPASWNQMRRLPPDLNPGGLGDPAQGPPAQIDVYTGGNVKWADVKVPNGITVVDQRLEAHGFKVEDGAVVEGKVTDLVTGKPLAAQLRLEPVQPQKQAKNPAMTVAADADGRWVLKKVPAGGYQIVADAEGYVPRVLGYLQSDEQPRWQRYDAQLARPAVITGRVTDDAGEPLADVDVRFGDVVTQLGGGYGSPKATTVKTDADGRFRSYPLPVGRASVWVHKPGYVRPGLGESVDTPKEGLTLTMMKAGKLVVTVDFTGTERPKAYIVALDPEGQGGIGSYGGSGHINDKNQMVFEPVPPGRYVVRGHPNPTSEDQKTGPMVVDVLGGRTTEVKLLAK